jgi:Ca2+-binding EF-hand superfamily protein
MIEGVAKDGIFTEKEAESVMQCLKCQQSLFGYLIVMDCLFLSMFLPLLVEDTLEFKGPADPDATDVTHAMSTDISYEAWTAIKIAYEVIVSFVFFSCCVHVMICGLFLGLSSYLMDAKSVLWMLVHCHSNFVFINSAMFPIFIGVILTGMLACILRLGIVCGTPAIIFASLALILSITYFNRMIRPLFFLLGTTSDGTWIANEEVDETLGRNTKRVLKKLLKSNNRNYSQTSMNNLYDRIAAGANGNGKVKNRDGQEEVGVDLDTLRSGIGRTSVMLTDYELKALFMAVDKDGDGVITRDEWAKMVNEEIEYNASSDFEMNQE